MADQTFAVHCGFFDAVNSDRTYSADEMNRPYKRVISNGVFATPNGTPSTDLQVTASSGMNIICKKGEGLFGDKWFENPSGIAITVPSNTGTVPRIDSVLVQVDTRTSGRVGNIVHRTGTPASSPVPPAINQTEGVVEYRLANIRVNAGVSEITQSMITDRRGSSDCPWVTSLIYQVDTSTLYDQWQAAYAEYFEEEKAIWDAWYAQLTEDLDVSMTLDRHVNTVTTDAQTTGYIPIGLAYNHNTDILEVYINGLRAVEGTHYVVVDDTKILVENQLQIGQTVTFVVMRSVISGSATNIMVLLQELESQIAGIAGGTPTVVDSTSDMTDTEKIYVLSSDSKWYYYSVTQEDWVIGGTYGGVPTDPTLSISGSAADAKAVGDALADKADTDDLTALGTRVTAVEDALDDVKGDLNSFEDAIGYVEGYSASKALSGLAPYYVDIKEGVLLKAGVTYAVEANLSTAPSNNPVYFYLRDSNDTNIFATAFRVGDTAISGEVNVNSDITVKAVAWAKVDSPTLTFSITPPPFELKVEDIQKEQTAFFEHQTSDNIFDKNSSYIVTGKLINLSGNIGSLSDNSNCFASYIPITAGTYCWLGLPSIYGASAPRIAGFNANKEYVKYFTGVAGTGAPTSNTTVYSFTFSESDLNGVAYLGYTGLQTMRNTLMFIEGAEYPQTYVPYVNEWLIPDLTVHADQIANIEDYTTNILSGKTIVFDGDSICNANSEIDSADPDGNVGNANNRGWCYRVGYPNNMTYYNLGRGGGTIAYVAANRHCISRDIDTIHTTYPNLDYLILEGGTNDADLLSDAQIGTMSETDYSGTYDDTTFIGALETLFYKAENYYPHSRIGFIIAQKMGGVTYASSRARRYMFFEKAMEVCKKWGIPYINLWDDTILNPMFVPMYDPNKTAQENREAGSLYIDGQHLTANGYDAISPKIASWIRSL